MALLRRRAVAVTPCKWTIRAVHPAQQGIAPCAVAFLLLASLLAAARFAAPARAADEPLHIEYTLVLPPDRSPRVDVIVTLRAADAGGVSAQMTLPEGVTPTDLWSPDGSAAVALLSDRVVLVESTGSAGASVAYSVRLRSGGVNPAGLPAAPYASLHGGDFVYLAGRDTLLRPSAGQPYSAVAAVQAPPGWHVFVPGAGLAASGEPVPFDSAETVLVVAGALAVEQRTAAGGALTVVAVGDAPWDVRETAQSLAALSASLAQRGFTELMAPLTFLQLRYPGPLRLNPLVSGFVAAGDTIVHWVGSGTADWWRKYAARDLVRWLVERTVKTAPDAAWFSAGLPEYVGLLLLYEAGYISGDDLYQALQTLHATGLHYSGPDWPSLVLAGVAAPRSHSAQRVLEFRAPLVAFLLDAEIRSASAGAKSVVDLWLDAARWQRQQPNTPFFTSSLLALAADYADLTSFAADFLFGSRIPPVNFDAVYRRWAGVR
ncbi:MAG: hypothetical protein C0P62_000715 [Bacillota bacterium]